MLENEFFPTPDPVIAQMLAPYVKTLERNTRWGEEEYSYLVCQGSFLDPQGGSGAILDYATKKLKLDKYKTKIVAIEIDLELRLVLQGKGYTVIGSDFLEYNEPATFGLIAANPPFSTGVKHAIKIWEVLASEGEAVVLLNQATINNPCDKERRVLLAILAGQINYPLPDQFIDTGFETDELKSFLARLVASKRLEYLGSCFKEAERPTDVEVVLVRLTKPKTETTFTFDDLNMQGDGGVKEVKFAPDALANRDVVRDLVLRYETTIQLLKDRQLAQSKVDFYLGGIAAARYESQSRNDDKSSCLVQEKSLSEQVDQLKSRFWNTVFQKTSLSAVTTSSFHDKFDAYCNQQKHMAFSERNIHELLQMMFGTKEENMKASMLEVFDKISSYCDDNKNYKEGWKTNKSWRLNSKIIHPWGISHDKLWGFRFSWNSDDIYTDLDKVLCWVGGTNVKDGVTTSYCIRNFVECIKQPGRPYQDEFESYFFKIRIFKKGTVHLKFKNLKLLEDFNKKVAAGKQWLGDGT